MEKIHSSSVTLPLSAAPVPSITGGGQTVSCALAVTRLAARPGQAPAADEWVGLLFNMAKKQVLPEPARLWTDHNVPTESCTPPVTSIMSMISLTTETARKNWKNELWVSATVLLFSFDYCIVGDTSVIINFYFKLATYILLLLLLQILEWNVGFTSQIISFRNENLSLWSYFISLNVVCLFIQT